MTTNQANQFIAEVLRGLWGRWEPKDEEIRGWADRLVRFDYGRAEKAVKDLFFSTTSRVTPPPKKVLAVLYQKATIRTQRAESEPVTIFMVIREEHFEAKNCPNFIFAKEFCVQNRRRIPAKEEIIRQAEATSRRMNDFYHKMHIIIYPAQKGKESENEQDS